MAIFNVSAPTTNLYTVSKLNQQCRLLLEKNFGLIKVQGEISNLVKPNSGHLYFTLKDNHAQVRCVLFKNRANQSQVQPKEGQEVIAVASVSLFEGRGDYQLLIQSLEETKEGLLQKEFLRLQKILAEAGLFDDKRKKTLPKFPANIGVITSATGAAIRDILATFKRLAPQIQIIIYPAQVQGNAAKQALCKQINIANQRQECDALILARGGGSLEDLWPFNEQDLAYAIFNSQIPIISGIGHETDTTIADLVADYRAETPTAAANKVCENYVHGLQLTTHFKKQLLQQVLYKIEQKRTQYQYLNRRLAKPIHLISESQQRLDLYLSKLVKNQERYLQKKLLMLMQLKHKLSQKNPFIQLKNQIHLLDKKKQRLLTAQMIKIQRAKERFAKALTLLQALSPLATLERGYAIALNQQGNIIHSPDTLKVGERLAIQLHTHTLDCEYKGIKDGK